jgi:Protein of unknown function (DUF3833)
MTETALRARPRHFARMMRGPAVVAALICAGSTAAAAPQPSFDPVTFFSGATESSGSLKAAFSSAKATHMTGFGAMRGGGEFVLDQTMTIAGDKKAQNRQWHLHQISPGHFGGTISDGKGPVTIDVAGNRLLIRYTMLNGMKVESVLTIDPGGRTGHNVSTVRKWGMSVANLSETITKR